MTWDTLTVIFPYAAVVAMGLIESLLTLNILDEITGTRGQGNRECVAQGGQCVEWAVQRHGWMRHDWPKPHQCQSHAPDSVALWRR